MNKLTNKQLLTVQNPIIYTGNELNQVIKKPDDVKIRFAFCFPEVYEIGMSYLGMKILYYLLNNREDTYCERVFAPSIEMENLMRKNNIELYGLETKDSIKTFDFVGFTLQYELTYTNILNMLDLANIPIYAKDREEGMPFVIAGGPCACNPEPLADFIDFFVIGEGEEVINEIMDVYAKWKDGKGTRKEFLEKVDKVQGVYVPCLYETKYNEDGTISEFKRKDNEKINITKRIIKDLDKVFFPTKTIVPYSSVIHDRTMLEIFRGCIRGCRFCQAGYIYRPVREKSVDRLLEIAKESIDSTGYEEMSLVSLSTSDYTKFHELASNLIDMTKEKKINLSLPSLRIDSIDDKLLDKMNSVRKSGLTLAPEAGTQRLRNVINKNVNEEEIFKACDIAFRKGWTVVKLYFMMGLPTETFEDLQGIADLANKIVDMFFKIPKNERGRNVKVTVSVSTFVPKPFTTFQWAGQNDKKLIQEKIEFLQNATKNRNVSFNWNNPDVSIMEAVIARGDRKVSKLIYEAWKQGAKFDGWDEHFDIQKWNKAFEISGLSKEFYAQRVRRLDEILPWEFINMGVSRKFFEKELDKALKGEVTPNCRQSCSGCGIASFGGGVCFE
ncbi:MAG: TIGR03960 family B12-binding radical SAM protein [Clostridiales bacterium]|nr:TIGR03960 family B12-binding radical SAM protein [Clostridiales bacterium]